MHFILHSDVFLVRNVGAVAAASQRLRRRGGSSRAEEPSLHRGGALLSNGQITWELLAAPPAVLFWGAQRGSILGRLGARRWQRGKRDTRCMMGPGTRRGHFDQSCLLFLFRRSRRLKSRELEGLREFPHSAAASGVCAQVKGTRDALLENKRCRDRDTTPFVERTLIQNSTICIRGRRRTTTTAEGFWVSSEIPRWLLFQTGLGWVPRSLLNATSSVSHIQSRTLTGGVALSRLRERSRRIPRNGGNDAAPCLSLASWARGAVATEMQ